MTTITNNTTNINIVPTRIECDHYQTPSFTDPNTIYDQLYDYDMKRWICNCLDTEKRHNPNCKHVILLRAFIKREKASQQTLTEKNSSSIELVQVLTRIANLEQESASLSKALYAQNELIDIKDQQVTILQDRLRAAEYTIKQQGERLDDQRELIATLQTSVCRLNERTINQDMQIQKLAVDLDQQGNIIQELELQRAEFKRMYEDQAQQIDKITEQISSQQKPAEQVVRIVVDGAKQARQERQPSEEKAPEEMNIKTVKDASGKITACKVSKFNVRVLGNCAAGCDCSIGIMDRQCGHMVKVDQFLSK